MPSAWSTHHLVSSSHEKGGRGRAVADADAADPVRGSTTSTPPTVRTPPLWPEPEQILVRVETAVPSTRLITHLLSRTDISVAAPVPRRVDLEEEKTQRAFRCLVESGGPSSHGRNAG
jgi:hypothetical protein